MQNAVEIANQFKHLQSKFKEAMFFKDYHPLNENRLLSIEYEIQTAVKEKSFHKAVSLL